MLLTVEGKQQKLSADWTIRFVEEEWSVSPVLYYKGKRVTAAWKLEMSYESPADSHDNANTVREI